MPEWGWRGPLKGAPSWSKRSRNTNGFRISPKSDGLIKRVTGPFVRPRVWCMIARTSRRGGEIDWTRVIGVPLRISVGVRAVAAQRRSGRPGARRLQGCSPPQQIVDQRSGRGPQLGQSCVDIATLVVSPQGGDRDVDRCANRRELKLDHCFAELLDAACSHGGAIAHETYRLAIPLGIDPVDRVLEHRGGAVIILGGDEDEAVGLRDRGGPSLYDLVRVRQAPRHGRRCWLIEERHRKVAKVEKPCVDAVALLQVLQNPLCGLIRETALPCASNDYRNDCHVFNPCCSLKEQAPLIRETDCLPVHV